jgi:putative peptidoglycan lipid II flippase
MITTNIKVSLSGSLKSSLIVALISGVAGLILLLQDVVIASHFATGGVADAYQFAISFPTLAINIFAGGTLLAVLVPILTQLEVGGRQVESAALIKQVRRKLGWFLLAVCVVWAIAYPYVLGGIAKGFSANTLNLSKYLLWISVPVLFFSGLVGMDAAVLNSRRHFVFISTLPAFMPATVILCVFLLEVRMGIYAAAIGMLFGSALQWLVSRQLTKPLLNQSDCLYIDIKLLFSVARNYATAVASSALLVGIILTDILMASTLPTGSTATYSYAVRPVILLLAFVTSVVGNIVLSFFSQLVAMKDWRSLKKQVLFWFGIFLLGAMPLVIMWHFWATEIVRLLYQRGAFGSDDAANVAAIQQVYILQIPFYLISVIGLRLMNSLNKHNELLLIAGVCFIVHLGADLWLAPHLSLLSIAWITNLTFVLQATLIILYLVSIKINDLNVKLGSKELFDLKETR